MRGGQTHTGGDQSDTLLLVKLAWRTQLKHEAMNPDTPPNRRLNQYRPSLQGLTFLCSLWGCRVSLPCCWEHWAGLSMCSSFSQMHPSGKAVAPGERARAHKLQKGHSPFFSLSSWQVEWLIQSFYQNLRGGREEVSPLLKFLILGLHAFCFSGTVGMPYQMRVKENFILSLF